jgi:cbb3-type cytochrome oxidase subunit 3
MKKYLRIVSFSGIALAVVSSLLVFNGTILMKTFFTLLFIGMVIWYATAPFWKRNKSLADEEK